MDEDAVELRAVVAARGGFARHGQDGRAREEPRRADALCDALGEPRPPRIEEDDISAS